MQWDQDRQPDCAGHASTPDLANEVVNFCRAISPKNTQGVTAIDLVDQAARMIQSIEDEAAETKARAHDIARRAVVALETANGRIRSLESAQSTAEDSLNEANARVEKAEQTAKAFAAQVAAIEDRLATAENRARNAETRAIDAEKILIQVEDAIRSLLLAKRQPLMGASAAAA
jgi:chromosome segregation ATPase